MALFNNSKKKRMVESQSNLQEASTKSQLDIWALMNQPYFQFTTNLTSIRNTLSISSTVKQSMLRDPIITQVINMWISDTLSRDIISNKIFDVIIKDNNSNKPEINKIINQAQSDINYLIENSNLEDVLVPILYQVIVDGITNVRVGFIDMYEDTKIKLFESNKKTISNSKDSFNKFTTTSVSTAYNLLREAPTFDDYESKSVGTRLRTKTRLPWALGRYYFEVLPQQIVPLNYKGITILYLDLDNQIKVLNPRNITTFINNRGNVRKLLLKQNPEDIEGQVYEIPLGKSFIDQAVTPWSMYNTSQDCTTLALMTRASIYRIFQVDVGSMSTEQTETYMQELKKRLTTRETINVREQHYSSAQTQIPLGDMIFLPIRNGVGSTTVESIGGDLNIQTDGPMNFFREELLASLGIAKELVYGSENGTLINTSATRADIRYLRTIQQFVSIMSLGLQSIFKDYLSMLGYDLSDISLDIMFKQLNSEEALQRIEYEQSKQDALSRVIDSLNKLGVDFTTNQYVNTRNELITRYIGEDILDLITKDENLNPTPIDVPTQDADNDITDTLPPLPSSDSSIDELPPLPEEPTEDTTEQEPEETPAPEVEPNTDTDVNPNPPFSLG